MKFGTDMYSTKKFSHPKMKYHFSLHMFNKMAVTLSLIVTELFCLYRLLECLSNSLSGEYIIILEG